MAGAGANAAAGVNRAAGAASREDGAWRAGLPLARCLARAVQARAAGTAAPGVALLPRVDRSGVALLQRVDAPHPGLLSPAAVAKAIRFYTAQPKQYTPAIMVEIQARVGVAQTGIADAPTVQAVASWQLTEGSADPVLKPDGMAGPRTLPQMFRSGLNVTVHAVGFGEDAQAGVIDRWHELTADERATELVRIVNLYLGAAGVPPVAANVMDEGDDAGQFDFATWALDIGRPALEIAQPTRDEAADIVDTIYHEARHAEQTFREAQFRALELRRPGGGAGEDARLAAEVAAELQIQVVIAEKAVASPLVAGTMKALIVKGWYDSMDGPDAARRNRILTEVDDASEALDKARERFDKAPGPKSRAALDRAQRRYDRAHDAYRDLPEEHDAWATGPMTGPGVTRGAPPAPVPAGLLDI